MAVVGCLQDGVNAKLIMHAPAAATLQQDAALCKHSYYDRREYRTEMLKQHEQKTCTLRMSPTTCKGIAHNTNSAEQLKSHLHQRVERLLMVRSSSYLLLSRTSNTYIYLSYNGVAKTTGSVLCSPPAPAR
jgi:hypothetical protein